MESITVLSLGAGVQSSTLALMAAAGEIEMPVAAIFADTQAEPRSVYKWLDWLETRLPFPVYRVTHGSLETAALRIRISKNGNPYMKTRIPAFVLYPEGKRGISQRQCTSDFKILPIRREVLRLMREHGANSAVQMIGISLDEVHRMKPSGHDKITNTWPLIDRRITRGNCLAWMESHGFPRPPRSACYFCPFHSFGEWERLRIEEPQEFERAVKFEVDYQKAWSQTSRDASVPYLHGRAVSLPDALHTEHPEGLVQLEFAVDHWGNECSGLCGV